VNNLTVDHISHWGREMNVGLNVSLRGLFRIKAASLFYFNVPIKIYWFLID
jgi:hypothetical protein